MAGSINRVVLVGNLTRDPELRHTPSGTPVCSLRLAVNTRRKDESGQWTDKPNYFDITVWGQQGENCAQYLSKGRPVAIDGRLEWREWEAQDGAKRQAVEVVAESVQFLGGRQDGEVVLRAGRRDAGSRRGDDFPDLTDRRRHSVLGASRWHRRNSNLVAAPARRRPRQAQELPLLPGQGERDRLQEPRAAPPLHLGEGEDPVAPDHRRVPAPPDPGRGGGQARARDGPPPVRRLARWKSSSSRTSRSSASAARSSTSRAATRGTTSSRGGSPRTRRRLALRSSAKSTPSVRSTRRERPSRRTRSPSSSARRCSGSRSRPGLRGRFSAP